MNYLYKLVTTKNVEINYDAFKKKELVECLATMRDIYFRLQQENQQLKRNCNIGNKNLNFYREEYKKLEHNWNDLKEFLENNWKETQDIWFVKIINKMKELERGVSIEN